MTSQTSDAFFAERKLMVERQIKGRGISDPRVLRAMGEVPRHLFVTEDLKKNSYSDTPLPIGLGQTISQPYVVAYMSECLDIKSTHNVLEIGTGSGYQAAILSRLAKKVCSIEIKQELSSRACMVFDELEYKNILLKVDDGAFGWEEEGPFDRVIVTAAPKNIPTTLLKQLVPGGKMIIPIGDGFQNLFLFEKKRNGKIIQKLLMPVIFVPMTGSLLNKV